MHADFDVYGGAMGLSSCCLYVRDPVEFQELLLRPIKKIKVMFTSHYSTTFGVV